MAKPKKTGLDYYYKSVHDMDDFRVMDLMEKYGSDGYVVLDMTMSCIYRNGYYLEMPIKRLALYIYRYIAGTTSKTSDDVAEIIMYCGEIGLFDSGLLGQSVLTSREIQEHYASVSARRKADKSKYWLLPNSADEPCEETSPSQSAEKTGVFAAKTSVYAAETRVSDTNNGISAAIIPQSKEKQSKADKSKADKSKANKTKPNESKAEQSKSKSKSARMSADEIFCVPEQSVCPNMPAAGMAAAAAGNEYEIADAYTASAAGNEYAFADAYAAAAGNEYEFADTYAAGNEYEFADTYADDTDAGYGAIENAYMTVTGKKLNGTDKAYIDEIKREGAYVGLIVQALKKVASRKKAQKINSFRYFMPMIRDMLKEAEIKPESAYQKQMSSDDGLLHNDTVYDDPYANCTTTEEYLAELERQSQCTPSW